MSPRSPMRIFVTRPIPEAGIRPLKARGYDVAINAEARDRPAEERELVAGARGTDAVLSLLTDKITSRVMDAGRPTLKIVANLAVGYDNIDLIAAAERNIRVTHTPGVLDESVAEHAFALLMAISKRIVEGDRYVREGKFRSWGPMLMLGADLAEKTLGLIGAGRIASRVAGFAHKGFRMKILYNDLRRNERLEDEVGATFVSPLEALIPQCDFLSLHCPLNAQTEHLIDERRLGLMKPSAYLINTARGPIVDEAALVRALELGKIKGAALDVFEFEPKVTEGLLRLDNVVMTPHTASASEATRNKMAEMAAANIIEALEGRTPPNLVKIS